MEEPASGDRRLPGRPVAIALRVMSASSSRRCNVSASSGKRAAPFSLGIRYYSYRLALKTIHVFCLRRLYLLDYRLDQIFRRDAVGQAIEVENDAMAQRRKDNGFQV